MIGIIIAIISGALMSIQGVFNTGITEETSIWVSTSFVQFTALIISLGAWLIFERDINVMNLFKIDRKYMLLGGVIGAFITYTVIKSISSLGPAKGILTIVISQLLIAYLIEVFGLFGVEKVDFELRKVIGMGISLLGIVIFQWK